MENNKMSNYKQFQLKTKDDYAYYLEYIIVQFATKLRRFERYLEDIEVILSEVINFAPVKKCLEAHDDINSSPTVSVEISITTLPSKIYDSYMDMTTASGLGILNLLADTQTSSVSYQSFRKLITKTNFANLLKPLEDKHKKMLDHFRDFRNWSAHIPQSLINAELVAAEKFDKDAKAKIYGPKSAILVPAFEEHATEYLVKLYVDCYTTSKLFRTMLLKIHEDYQSLTGKETKVDYALIPVREYESETISDISLSMQQKKFGK